MTALIEPGRLAVVASDPVADAVREWARRVAAAGLGWGPDYDRPNFEELSELDRQVLTLVHNAAATLSLLRQGLADERDRAWLEALVKVPQHGGRGNDASVWAAVRIVEDCVQGLSRTTRVDWAGSCVRRLANEVDPAFGALTPDGVGELLGRFKWKNEGRRSKGKLSAAGIVAELNKLVRWPLGRLTTNAIGGAERREAKRRENAPR